MNLFIWFKVFILMVKDDEKEEKNNTPFIATTGHIASSPSTTRDNYKGEQILFQDKHSHISNPLHSLHD